MANETQRITVTNASASYTFLIRAAGGTDTATFTFPITAGELETLINSLDEYADYEASVSGSATLGSGTYSGLFTAVFSGGTDVPQLDIRQRNEIYSLDLSGFDANQLIGFKLSGSSTYSTSFNKSASNADIRTALLVIYNAGSGDVSVTGSVDTRFVEFKGSYVGVNVTDLELWTGDVHSWVVTNGDSDSDYSSNGGAAFALGITEGQFQTNQRALSGQYSAVVSKGSTAAPSSGQDWTTGLQFSGYAQWTDNNDATHSGLNNGEVSVIDLGQSRAIENVRFVGQAQATTGVDTLYIEGSNSSNMSGAVTILSRTDSQTTTSITDVTLPSASTTPYRYVRVRWSSPNSNQFEIYEIGLLSSISSGSASLKNNFPITATPTTPPTKTGTGAVAAVVTARGNTSEASRLASPLEPALGISVVTTISGGNSVAYKIVTEDEEGDSVLLPGGASQNGFVATAQVWRVDDEGSDLSVIFEHSDTGNFSGEEEELTRIDNINSIGSYRVESDELTDEVKAHARVRYEITGGSTPGYIVWPSLANYRPVGDS